MSTVRVNGYRVNMNQLMDVKAEASRDAGLQADMYSIVDAAKPHDNGDKYLNADELRRGVADLIGRRRRDNG